jgi:4-hydroxy-tetrahydrodipicolinate synthase
MGVLAVYYRPFGSWVAIPTPYDEGGKIRFDTFADLIEFHVRHGTSALLVMGSCGEVTLLTTEERRQIIREVSLLAKGRLPVFFGTACPTTDETAELSRYAEKCGADGVVLTVPPYLNAPQEAVYEHLRAVMESVRIPVATYNNPARVVVNIEPATIARLAEQFDHYVADKEAVPNSSQLIRVLELTRGRLHVLCCDYPGYAIVLTNLAMGGHGTANIAGNIIPEEMAEISRPWACWDDVVRTRRLYFRFLPLLRELYSVTNPVYVKAALRILGFKVGRCRRPLPEIAHEKAVALTRLMDELGILAKYSVCGGGGGK